MSQLFSVEALLSLLTLTILEIVLGIDNIVFLSITTSKLPHHQQKKARRLGLSLAMITRVLLLCSISWVMTLTKPIFNFADWFGIKDAHWVERLAISGRDIILLAGGIFLIFKSSSEIWKKVEDKPESEMNIKVHSFAGTIVEILALDIIFSLDSVITAVGMAQHLPIMIAAVIIAVIIMLFASELVSNFVNNHASVKMLALCFLLLIGISLLIEAFEFEIPKGYIYTAMFFSLGVEVLNIIAHNNHKKHLKAYQKNKASEKNDSNT